MTSKPKKQPEGMGWVCVMLWADPVEPGMYLDQPPGDRAGYRKPKKYTEDQKQALECAIGEECVVIKP